MEQPHFGDFALYYRFAASNLCSPDMHVETRKSLFRCMCLVFTQGGGLGKIGI